MQTRLSRVPKILTQNTQSLCFSSFTGSYKKRANILAASLNSRAKASFRAGSSTQVGSLKGPWLNASSPYVTINGPQPLGTAYAAPRALWETAIACSTTRSTSTARNIISKRCRFLHNSRLVYKNMGAKAGTNYVGVEYPQPTPAVIEKTRKNVFDLFSLKGKVASISGSSGGIGYEVAEAFAQAGADVALWYNSRNPEQKVKYLESEYGVKVKAYKVAIDQYEAVEAAIQQQIKDFGKIDIFVANAGVIWTGTSSILDEPDNKEWDKVMGINLDGVYYCAKAVGRHFRERGQGNLILTGSMSGHIINIPDTMAAYCTSKAAVIHLGKALALEWAKFARVNVVSPGYIKTDMTEAKEAESIGNWGPITPMGRMADSRELVGAYLYFASDASTYTTGTDLIVDGGYCAQ